MISQKLLHILDAHHEEIAKRWMKDVRQDLDTISYKKVTDEKLREAAHDLFRHMSRLIKNRGEEVSWLEEFYVKRGAERHKSGFRLSEVVRSMTLAKHHFWNFVQEEGIFDSATDLFQGLELLDEMSLFFDRVVYYLVLGYEREATVEAWKKPHER